MAQPQAYDRTVDFTQRDGDDTDHAGINAELDAAATSINGIRNNLALIQKDDGGLANGIVTPDSLTPEVFEALTLDISEQVADASASAQSALNSAISAAASAAAAAASQVAANTSENASALNASGSAASASAAQASQTAAAASAAAALVSQNAAAASATSASTSAGTATTQAGIATTQAGTATTQAGNAATSATTATTQAGIATTQASTATTQAGIATTQAGNAATYAAASAASALASAASAAITNMPAVTGKALSTLRVKADETGYETRTPLEAAADLGLIYTGFVVSTDDDVAPSGWVMSSGRTIGSAASGATERANADTAALFAMYWRTRDNTLAPIQDSAGVASTRGASAAADFSANKRLPLPDRRGRIDAGKDDMGGTAANRLTTAGAGVAGTTLGAVGGSQTHTLTIGEMPSHNHGSSAEATPTQRPVGGGSPEGATAGVGGTGYTGGSAAHNNTQPTYVSNKIIKL